MRFFVESRFICRPKYSDAFQCKAAIRRLATGAVKILGLRLLRIFRAYFFYCKLKNADFKLQIEKGY
jgi:hypothetical protein